jgi:hypothetical protein
MVFGLFTCISLIIVVFVFAEPRFSKALTAHSF